MLPEIDWAADYCALKSSKQWAGAAGTDFPIFSLPNNGSGLRPSGRRWQRGSCPQWDILGATFGRARLNLASATGI